VGAAATLQDALMKTAIVGSAGQLGRAITAALGADAVPLTRDDLDLLQPATVAPTLEVLGCGRVINCSAYNLVDKAESEPDAAFAVNAWGVRSLALACKSLGIPLVHFSTDYVFGLDTDRRTPWSETDAPGPASAYGLSKLNGEYWALQADPRNLVIRTCGLYGERGTGGKGGNFVDTMLRVASDGKPLRVVADQRCTPSNVIDIAAGALALIERGQGGLFHLTNAGDCSWHEFAQVIFTAADISPSLTPISSAEYPTAARRPRYSVLSTQKALAAGMPPLRDWQSAVTEYVRRKLGRH